MVKKLLVLFIKKNDRVQINENLELKKYLKEKAINYMSNGKVIIIHFVVGLLKRTLHKMSKYFPKPYEPFGGDIKVKVDLSNYAKKADLKNITHVDT